MMNFGYLKNGVPVSIDDVGFHLKFDSRRSGRGISGYWTKRSLGSPESEMVKNMVQHEAGDESIYLWKIPSGKRLHNYGKIHHV